MKTNQQVAIDEVAGEVYAIAADHGFHREEVVGTVSLERLASFVANLHGEASELWEAGRKGTLHDRCDKVGCLPTNLEVEMEGVRYAAGIRSARERARFSQATLAGRAVTSHGRISGRNPAAGLALGSGAAVHNYARINPRLTSADCFYPPSTVLRSAGTEQSR